MTDLFAELRHDHRRVTALLEELRGDPATSGPPPERRTELAERLVIAESAHEVLEETIFWPVFHSLVDDDDMHTVGVAQEQNAKKLLNELEKTDAASEEFRTLLLQVTSDLRRHISFEEGQVWPRLQLVLGRDQREELGRSVVQSRPRAPTRPHPLTPADPRVLRTVGPVVGAVDRARDLLRSRG